MGKGKVEDWGVLGCAGVEMEEEAWGRGVGLVDVVAMVVR